MKIVTILFILIIGSTAHGSEPLNNPVEVGHVHWQRDFNAALKESAKNGKPLLVLFQEIPGCSGVRQFGREVLANPALVQAIESEFIPVLVYNNRTGGMDETLLKRYKEPSWNYQVIRFFNGKGEDIIPRKDRIWTLKGVAQRMIEALTALNRQVSPNLADLARTP